jgi:nucleoside-diphosphate-sugar epimerase
MEDYLITGVNGALGSYLSHNLTGGEGLHRDNFDDLSYFSRYNTVVHCAFNKNNEIKEFYQYLEDNIFLTQKLLDVSYSRFIYISSIDVYNGTNNYSLFKRLAESMVERKYNTTILRCPMMLGSTMKENHLTKMLCSNNEKLTLSGESTFNYILYKDILGFIQREVYKDINGIFDLVATDNVKLKDVKEEFDSTAEFGDYVYKTQNEFNRPIYTGKTSIETIKEYFK